MRKILIGSLVCIAIGVVCFGFAASLVSGLVPGARFGPVSIFRAYPVQAAYSLRSAIMRDQPETADIARVPRSREEVGHVFTGTVLPAFGHACLIDMQRAAQSSLSAAKNREGRSYPSPEKYPACDGYARITPPMPSEKLMSMPELDRQVRHRCYSTIIGGNAFQLWEHHEKPTGNISIATLLPGQTAEQTIARLKAGPEWDREVEVGTKAGVRVIPVSDILANTEILPLDTIQCDGFTVLHFRTEAKVWPHPGQTF